jgi:hypothetical protein
MHMAERLVKEEPIVLMTHILTKSKKGYSEGYFLLVALGVIVVEGLGMEAELVAPI